MEQPASVCVQGNHERSVAAVHPYDAAVTLCNQGIRQAWPRSEPGRPLQPIQRMQHVLAFIFLPFVAVRARPPFLTRALVFLSKVRPMCYLGHGIVSYSLMIATDAAFVTLRLVLRKGGW